MYLKDYAKDLQSKSLATILLRSKEKIPIAGSSWKGRSAPLTNEEISLIESQKLNVGILTGEVNNIVVVDIDPRNGGSKSFEELEKLIGPIREKCKYIVKTGGNGFHLLFKLPDGINLNSQKGFLPGLDFLSNGSYFVAPFSTNKDGNQYFPLLSHNDKSLYVDDLSELPSELIRYLEAKKKSSHRTNSTNSQCALKNNHIIPEGQRNEQMFKKASALRRVLSSVRAVTEALQIENSEFCKPPLPKIEIVSIGKSVEKYETDISINNLNMRSEASYGLAGRLALEVSPINGISKEAVLFQFLICLSTLCAQKFYYSIGGKKIHAADYLVLVGTTGSSKKGTSFSDVKWFFDQYYPEFTSSKLKTGVNSGEGLINCIRNKVVGTDIDKRTGKEIEAIKDEGALSKIVLFLETEFSRLLKAGKRDGSTVTEIYRNAWDGVPLEINTSQRSIRSTDYCVSLIAHITPKELKSLVSDIDSSNGYLNRFMFCFITGGVPKPFPESFDRIEFTFTKELVALFNFINAIESAEIVLADNAKELYLEIYNEFYYRPEDKITELLSRNTQHLLKMAMLYAIIDQSQEIKIGHLKASKALIDYSSASIQELFGKDSITKKEAKVLRFLSSQNGTAPRGKIQSDCFRNNSSKEELDSIQDSLIDKKLIQVSSVDGIAAWMLT